MSLTRSWRRREIFTHGAVAMSALAAPTILRAQGARSPINIINTQGNATVTVQEMMRRQGYLQEFGVEPKVTYVVDGSKLMGSLLSGENDICVFSGFSQVLTAIEKGAKLKILAGALVKPQHAVYSARANIKSIKDLAGKTIATGSVGALLHAMMISILRKHGVDEKTVRFVNIGSAPDVFRAIAAGTVDAGAAEIDVYEQQAKFGVHVLEGGDLWKEIPDFTYQAAYASDRAIAQKRDVLVRTLAAYAKLYRYMASEGSKDAYVAAQTAVLGKADPVGSAWQWSFFRDNQIYATDLVLSPERIQYMQALNQSLDVQKRILPYEGVTDMSLARDALKLL